MTPARRKEFAHPLARQSEPLQMAQNKAKQIESIEHSDRIAAHRLDPGGAEQAN
jgi:hypothetical protein